MKGFKIEFSEDGEEARLYAGCLGISIEDFDDLMEFCRMRGFEWISGGGDHLIFSKESKKNK